MEIPTRSYYVEIDCSEVSAKQLFYEDIHNQNFFVKIFKNQLKYKFLAVTNMVEKDHPLNYVSLLSKGGILLNFNIVFFIS